MPAVRSLRLPILLAALLALALPAFASMLDDITKPQEGRSMRWSTGVFDPESNADAYHIVAGQKLTFAEIEGPGEIRRIWMTIMGDDRRYPRTLVMRWYWDDSDTPSVEVPVGDFFAAGNGMKCNVSTYPIEVTSYGRALNCFWHMPFKRKARLEFEHQGEGRLTVYCQVSYMKYEKPPKDLMYFHAQYRQEAPPVKRFTPYTICDIQGDGHMAGVILSSQNTFDSWFGEADDRYYIDGEAEPSLVGTGTEDYFTDGWNLRLFTNLNAGVSIKERNGEDCRVTMYRWHLHEPIVFHKSLKVDVERRSYIATTNPETGRTESWDFKYRPDFWSSVAFWYQTTINDNWPALAPAKDRINPEIFLETTNMAAKPDKGGITTSPGLEVQQRSNRTCNRKLHTWLENHTVGSWMEVPLTVADKGRYSISVYQSLKEDRGIWKVSLVGGKLAEPIILDSTMDFYDPFLSWHENYPENAQYGTWMEKKCGVHALLPGEYRMRFECIGTHPLSFDPRTGGKGYNLALDGISLRKMYFDDPYGWIQDYLVEEEQLFDKMIAEAKATVETLGKAVDAYKIDHGKYPESLSQLTRRAGDDGPPYITKIPRDPWGQEYQYAAPGKFNPTGFDVWSWHGNSRRPSEWLGNWKAPYKVDDAQEGEAMKPLGQAEGVRCKPQDFTLKTVPPSSGDAHMLVHMNKPGDWIEFELPAAIQGGRTVVSLALVKSRDYGEFRFSINGMDLSGAHDTYSKSPDRMVVDVGAVDLAPGKPVLRMECVGQNDASKGCMAGIDAVLLTRIP